MLGLFLSRAATAPRRPVLSGGHVPKAVARLATLGTLPGAERLKLAIGLPLRNEAELDGLLQQLYDPASTNYHRYLTPEEFAARFGPAQSDYQALMDFAKSNGLSVTVTHPNRVVLDVEGKVADIQKAFHVALRVYRHPQEARDFYAPDVEPTVDSPVPILHISGLDDYSIPHPNFVIKPAGLTNNATPNSGSGPGGTYRGYDFRAAYVPGTSLTGTGQTVGLLQFDGFYTNDIATYASQAGLPNIPLTVVPIDGGVSTPGSGNGEVCLDIQMVMAMAPGVSRIYIYEAPNPSPWVDLLNRMATDNLSKQLSCSWGGGSHNASAEVIFKQMAAQGQSFFNATGDSDAFTGSISFPSESTNITEVGGTTLTTGSGAAYSSETVWNWGNSQGSSGGVSTYYQIPSYQQGLSMVANQGSTTMRNVPDVALTADNVYVVYNNGSTGTFGGTSCAAPLWAGFTALMNQQAASIGQPMVGFLNPALYNLGKGPNYSSVFHDITTGNNFSSSSPTKYAAVAGYDLCTGWGTPKGTALINALTLPPVPVPNVVSNSFTLTAEGCTNGVVDPAETVTMNFGLKNLGTANTTNLTATLLANSGILFPSGPQTYGVLGTNGAAVSRAFTFTAVGNCGNTNAASLHLQDGAADLGTLTFSFRLGQLAVTTLLSENFDGVTAPAVPAGWSTSGSGAQPAWVTSTSARDTAPNAAFSPDPASVGLNELDSPAIALPAGPSQLTFRHSYDLESTYDGGVLEIEIGGGAWADILAAGGSFVSGGYIGVLSSSYSNPLAGRDSWNGNSGGFITTVVNLPAAASGQTIQLRWRCGSDNSVSKTGWYVDTVSVTSSTFACCTSSADLAVSLAASPEPVIAGQNLSYTLAVTNLGPDPASSVTLTDALPAGVAFVSASPGCSHAGDKVVCAVGSLPSSAGSNFTVVVVPLSGGLITNSLTVTSPTPDPEFTNNTAVAVTTVDAPAVIVVQPESQAAIPGSNVTFQVTASGATPLAYQWQFNGTNLDGAVVSSLTLTNVQMAQGGTYTVLVTNDFGSVVSSNAVLTVLDPWIVSQPKAQSVLGGASASFTVAAVGTLPLNYEWFKDGIPLNDGTNLSGTHTDTLTVPQVQAGDAGTYSVVVSNLFGQVLSSNATLVANFPAAILSEPLQHTVPAGSTVLFAAGIGGSSPITLQWQHAGTNLADGGKFSGTATSELVISNVQAGELGYYSLAASNAYGNVTSSNALLALRPLVAWGRDDYHQADIPPGLTNVQSVAGGLDHSLALRTDGTIMAWGAGTTDTGVSPNHGQCIVPAALSNVLQVVGGFYHNLALTTGGTVVAWGAGTTNSGSSPNFGQAMVPIDLSNVVAVAAGAYHSVGLQSDGTLMAWGAGTTNSATSPHYGQAIVPNGLNGVVAVAAGGYHTLALKKDGTVAGWGAGATNTGVSPQFGQTEVPEGLSNVVMIAAGTYHSIALRSDGTVVAWGNNTFGQTNTPNGLSNVVSIAAGGYSSLALEADGTMMVWGDNTYSETNTPTEVTNVVGISGGGFHALALEGDGQPHITVQPWSQSVVTGRSVSLMAVAGGTGLLSYQWRLDGTNLSGASLSSYTVVAAQPADAGDYSVEITNAFGAAVSSNATLTVLVGPAIATQPTNQTALAGASVSFNVGAAGSQPLSYQWCYNQTNLLSGAAAETLLLTNVQPDQAGSYTVIVTNEAGSVTSDVAMLTVLQPPTISSLTLTGSVVSISFPTETGLSYVLEYKRLLDDPAWSNLLPSIIGTGGLLTIEDTNAPADSRFYRLRRQ